MNIELRWRQPLGINTSQYYQRKLVPAVNAGLGYVASGMEDYAKRNAPWTDRTGAARRGLHGYSNRVSRTAYAAFISHGATVHYGQFLEARENTAIINETLQAFGPRVFPAIRQMLERLGRS